MLPHAHRRGPSLRTRGAEQEFRQRAPPFRRRPDDDDAFRPIGAQRMHYAREDAADGLVVPTEPARKEHDHVRLQFPHLAHDVHVGQRARPRRPARVERPEIGCATAAGELRDPEPVARDLAQARIQPPRVRIAPEQEQRLVPVVGIDAFRGIGIGHAVPRHPARRHARIALVVVRVGGVGRFDAIEAEGQAVEPGDRRAGDSRGEHGACQRQRTSPGMRPEADRPFHEAIRRRRQHEGDRDRGEALHPPRVAVDAQVLEHQERPMPQVQRIADEPDPDHPSPRKQPAVDQGAGAGGDQACAPGDRDGRAPAGKRLAAVESECGPSDQRDPEQRQRRGERGQRIERAMLALRRVQGRGQERTGREFPESRQRRIERRDRRGARQPQAERQRGAQQECDRAAHVAQPP